MPPVLAWASQSGWRSHDRIKFCRGMLKKVAPWTSAQHRYVYGVWMHKHHACIHVSCAYTVQWCFCVLRVPEITTRASERSWNVASAVERPVYVRLDPICEKWIPCYINMLFTTTYNIYMLHNVSMHINMYIKHICGICMSPKTKFQQISSLTNNIIFICHQSQNSRARGGTAPDTPLPGGICEVPGKFDGDKFSSVDCWDLISGSALRRCKLAHKFVSWCKETNGPPHLIMRYCVRLVVWPSKGVLPQRKKESELSIAWLWEL